MGLRSIWQRHSETIVAVLVAANVTAALIWQLQGDTGSVDQLRADLANARKQLEAQQGGFTGKVDPIVVAMCLTDATEGQMNEIQVAVKSLIYQAPPVGTPFSALDFYFLAGDQKSFSMFEQMMADSKLEGSSWPIPTSFHIIDASALHHDFANNIVRGDFLKRFWIMHYIGAWWRLMLPWMLPDVNGHIIYIDTDVWFRDNVAGMWLERQEDPLIQWSLKSRTSGVILLNLPVMKRDLWDSFCAAACAAIRENRDRTDKNKDEPFFVRPHIKPSTGDQALLQTITEYWPDMEGPLSEPWSGTNVEHYKLGKEWYNQFEGGGVLHHNGGGKQNTWAYWEPLVAKTLDNGTIIPPALNGKIWRTAVFFADLPWHWLVYHGKILTAATGGQGYQLKVTKSIAPKDHAPFAESYAQLTAAWARTNKIINTTQDCRTILTER